ncbi:B-box zinc finger protein 32 [Solanum stenotomum]|uniref:B-box zinc finger protein 32 n=1 Tax=Solanum stenotomum TaxID=172797 RepID=UPI0020D0BE58|nr:B-box zinc finger protein 32 [Solanum stenotomum]
MEVMSSKLCELCNDQAALFCPSDSAFLCFHCDTKVHQANFLVSRHLRLTLCSHCNSLTKNRFSPCSPRRPALCPSCSRNSSADSDLGSLSSSSSSTCVSSTQSSAVTQKINISSSNRKQFSEYSTNDSIGEVNSGSSNLVRSRSTKLRDPRAATCVFMHWCTKLGMNGEERVVQTACSVLAICFSRFRGLPLRVALAACFWFGLKNIEEKSKSTWQSLKKLEEISGVPAKIILATELKLRKIVKTNNRRRQGMEESWAESST